MTSFSGLDAAICDIAFRMVFPTIKQAADMGIANKLAGSLIVLNPAIPYEPKYRNAIVDDTFGALVLWATDFGNEDEHDIPKYERIASAKAYTSYLTGLPSHLVQQQYPSLYTPDMTKWGGSAVAGVGPMRLIVAFSGVQWNFDQMISEMMISAIQALCHEEMRAVMDDPEPLILA